MGKEKEPGRGPYGSRASQLLRNQEELDVRIEASSMIAVNVKGYQARKRYWFWVEPEALRLV